MATEWFYAKGDEQIGPVSESDLKSLAQSGSLTANDLVWNEGMPDWQLAEKVGGLFPSIVAKKMPPPLPRKPATPDVPPQAAVPVDSPNPVTNPPAVDTTSEAIPAPTSAAQAIEPAGPKPPGATRNPANDNVPFHSLFSDKRWLDFIHHPDFDIFTKTAHQNSLPKLKAKMVEWKDKGHISHAEHDAAQVQIDAAMARRAELDAQKARIDPAIADRNATAVTRGKSHLRNGDYDQAIADFTEAIRLQPDNAMVYKERGDAHELNDEWERAIDDYTNAIQLEPDYALAYLARGDSHALSDHDDNAIVDYTEAGQSNVGPLV